MKKRNIAIVDFNQPAIGVGGVETVGHLLKNGLLENGYKVWSLFFYQKSEKSDTDIEFPEKSTIDNKINLEFLIKTIEQLGIGILVLQGGYKKDIIKLCAKAKERVGIKLIYPIHFHPLMGLKEYDDYCERYIQQSKTPLARVMRSIYCKSKHIVFTINNMKRARREHCDSLFNSIDAFVLLTQKYADIAKTLYDKKLQEHFYTIANPIELDEQVQNNEKENIVLFVGRLTYQKRIDRLLHIWKNLHCQFPKWKLVIVGDGDYSNEYKSISKDLCLENIEYVGQQPAASFFQKSKIVCLTSSYEAQPMVLIEAQKYGCVPIAYNSFEAATDIIREEYNGLLIKPFKHKKYTKALTRLMSDENLRQQLAKNGLEHIKKFNISTIIQEWINLFNRL